MTVAFRRLRQDDDLAELTALIHRAYAPLAAQGMRYWATHQTVADTAERCGKGETWLAIVDGRIAATITYQEPNRANGAPFYDRDTTAKFQQFCVDPSQQGTGIGARLMGHVEGLARSAGAHHLALDTSERAHGLIALYERRGYRFIEFVDYRPQVNYRSVCLGLDLRQAGVRRLGDTDAQGFFALRRQGLQDVPLAFGSSVDDDRFRTLEPVYELMRDHPTRAMYGFFFEDQLVGTVGVMRQMRHKTPHRAHVWGMYVAPSARGKGAGRLLIEACIHRSRAWDLERLSLCVTSAAAPAKRLYERVGFTCWGVEERAIQFDGVFADESHMVLKLK